MNYRICVVDDSGNLLPSSTFITSISLISVGLLNRTYMPLIVENLLIKY